MTEELTWKDLEVGNIITEAGNGSFRKTGDWRTERPILDREKCIKCAIRPGEDGYYEADLYYCKGCSICASICPAGAITMIEEEE
jgi:pyruvate ferredoxin oxidoreductase delta subunit